MHKPVCVTCKIEMQVEKVGVVLLDYAHFGPYQLHNGDVWHCSGCGTQIVTNFGDKCLHHNDGQFPSMLLAAQSADNLVRCFENERQARELGGG